MACFAMPRRRHVRNSYQRECNGALTPKWVGGVEDIEATIRELRVPGSNFEEYDLHGLKTVHGIAEIAGNISGRVALSAVSRQRWEFFLESGDR